MNSSTLSSPNSHRPPAHLTQAAINPSLGPLLASLAVIAVAIFGAAPAAHAAKPHATPRLVQTVDDSVNQPYINTQITSFAGPNTGATLSFDIPAGKRLIIETIAVSAVVYNGAHPQVFIPFNSGGGYTMPVPLHFDMTWPNSVIDIWMANQPLKARFDAPADSVGNVKVFVGSTGTDGAYFYVTILGYLVDI